MNKLIYQVNFFILLVLSGFMISLTGCEDEPVTAIVSVNSDDASGSETAGTVTVNLSLSNALASETQIQYTLDGAAALNGDYRLLTPSPITVPAGATSAEIKIEIINDDLVEIFTIENNEVVEVTEKDLVLQLTSATGNASISQEAGANDFVFSITDDDDVPTSGMKVDLFWEVINSNNIDDVDLNMYALYDVVIENNSITDAKFYTNAGVDTTGFETLTVTSTAPDSEYYIAVEYLDGTQTAEFTFFVYLTSSIIYANDSFSPPTSSNEELLIYGPVATKSGDTFSRKSGIIGEMKRSKLKIAPGLLKN